MEIVNSLLFNSFGSNLSRSYSKRRILRLANITQKRPDKPRAKRNIPAVQKIILFKCPSIKYNDVLFVKWRNIATKYLKNFSLSSTRKRGASIAQLVEQLICNQWVGSSSLSGGTMFSITYIIWCFSFLSVETQGKQNTLAMSLFKLCIEG